MAVHVAIVRSPYDRLILEGVKTVECRLTKRAHPPFGAIEAGERIYFKRSAGPFFAVAVADRVWMADQLTPGRIEELRRQFNPLIHGREAYWRDRRDARYATLIWLREVRPASSRPKYKPRNMRAWYALEDEADPLSTAGAEAGGGGRGRRKSGRPDAAAGDGGGPEGGVPFGVRPDGGGPDGGGAECDRVRGFEVLLTRGAFTQRCVRIARWMERFPPDARGGRTRREAGEPVALHLKGGPEVLTDIVGSQKMFRWRGWGRWFDRMRLKPGDGLRFTPVGEGADARRGRSYLVEPVRRSNRPGQVR